MITVTTLFSEGRRLLNRHIVEFYLKNIRKYFF
jgi:hypothetical protein